MQLSLRGTERPRSWKQVQRVSVSELKELVQGKTGVPVEEQRLTTGIVELSENNRRLGAYNIEKDANLQLHLRSTWRRR